VLKQHQILHAIHPRFNQGFQRLFYAQLEKNPCLLQDKGIKKLEYEKCRGYDEDFKLRFKSCQNDLVTRSCD
jgi:hypothetical protein